MTMKGMLLMLMAAAVGAGPASPAAYAGVPGGAAREAAEAALRLLGREAETEGTDALACTIERLAMRHGDQVLAAVREGGPEALQLIEQAGVRGEQAARVLARYGPGAARIVERPALLALVERHGDDVVQALLRYPGLAEPVVVELGKPGARALATVWPRNARRLAMLVEDGSLQRMGWVEEMLAVVERYGDRDMGFIWRNKGALAVGTVLASFVRDPEPFLSRGKEISGRVASAGEPSLVDLTEQAAGSLSEAIWWPTIGLNAVLAGWTIWRIGRRVTRSG
jgi:hypothetical protein